MTLWLLRPVGYAHHYTDQDGVGVNVAPSSPPLPMDDNPWEPWYDKTFGFVVWAADETAARQLAEQNAGAEEGNYITGQRMTPWIDARYSTCVALSNAPSVPMVVIQDTARA